MGHHIVDGQFKSDKYGWSPPGFFPLKISDPVAQKCILLYSILTKDAELADDLTQAVLNARREAALDVVRAMDQFPAGNTGDPSDGRTPS